MTKYIGATVLAKALTALEPNFEPTSGVYLPIYRAGSGISGSYYDYPITLSSSTFYGNYRFIPDVNWLSPLRPNGVGAAESNVYQSTVAASEVDCQFSGESIDVYAFKDASYGSMDIDVDGVNKATVDLTSSPAAETIIATCEVAESWSNTTDDAVNYIEGANSKRITNTSSDSSLTAEYIFGSTQDYSAISDESYVHIWIKGITNIGNIQYVSVLFDATNATPGAYTNYAYFEGAGITTDGLYLRIKKTWFLEVGTFDWSTVYKMYVKLRIGVGATSAVSFDDIKWKEAEVVATVTGLSTYGDHTLTVKNVSGTTNLAFIKPTGTQEAWEQHRMSIYEVGPALCAQAIISDDDTYWTRAIANMDYIISNVQLGNRNATNRVNRTDGVGSLEEAYYVSGSNTLQPGAQTVTRSSFGGIAMGLTYLAVQAAGKADAAKLLTWKTALIAWGDFEVNKGYAASTYYNTANDSFLRANALYLLYLVTKDAKWKAYAEDVGIGYLLGNPTDPFIHTFKGDITDMSDITTIRSYFEEHEETTILQSTIGAMGISDTTITFASGGFAVLFPGITASNYTSTPINALIDIDGELIKLKSFVSGDVWNIEREQLGSTLAAHSNGATVRRGFDLSYTRVQSPAAYMFGVLSKSAYYCNLGKIIWNSVEDRITASTGAFDISGGSRYFATTEGYISTIAGLQVLSAANQDWYPSRTICNTIIDAVDSQLDTYDFIPGDTVSQVPANTLATFFTASFIFGWANVLIYLGYLEGNQGFVGDLGTDQ